MRYALPINGLMLIIAATLLLPAARGSAATRAEEKGSIEITGKLQTGVVAVGGETTGTTITTADGTVYELDLQKDAALIEVANALKGQGAVAHGTVKTVKGVESGERKIMKVSVLRKPGPVLE